MESLYHMMQQPENHIPDHSPQHIGQDIVHLKISPAGDQLDRLHAEAGHECRKGISKKPPKPRKCPGTDKSIGNKQQYIFHDKRMVPRIRRGKCTAVYSLWIYLSLGIPMASGIFS